jgi:signal transduction histidine kinase
MSFGAEFPDSSHIPQPSVELQDGLLSWMQDIAPYGIFTTDGALIVRSWNHWLSTHSGLTADEVIGRPLLALFPDLVARKLDTHFQRALCGEVSVLSTALHRYLLPLPTTAPEFGVGPMLQTVRIAPLPLPGRGVGTITMIEDVSQREMQAAILRRQQGYDRLLSEVLALFLKAESPSDAAAALFPRIAAPLKLDMYVNYLVGPDDPQLRLHAAGGVSPEARKAMATLAVGESMCGCVAATRTALVRNFIQADASEEAAEVRRLGLRSYAGFPLVIGDRLLGTLGFGSYAHDVIPDEVVDVLAKVAQYLAISLERTQREAELRLAQDRLGEHAVDLERKVAERTAKLRDTIAQLESFTYTVAHDLRAPIRALMGYAEVLLTEYQAALPEDGRGVVERLHRASHRLEALTRDLLKFSRIGRDDIRLTPVDVREVVQEIVALTPALQNGTLKVQLPLGQVLAQRTLLQQSLANLFDNALKFMPPGTRPTIIVRGEMRRDGAHESGQAVDGLRWRVWVEDNGIGIPAHSHRKIFGIFERLPGPVAVEGTGIGLAIVARAMEQMRGACGVESEVGEGSRFWLELEPAPKT